MKIKSIFPNTAYRYIFLYAIILIAPISPFWHYANTAPTYLSITILVSLFLFKDFHIVRFKVVDFGFLIFSFAVFFSFISEIIDTQTIPLGSTHLTFLVMITTYFLLITLGNSRTYAKQLSILLLFAFACTAIFIIYTAHQENYNYAQLTNSFNYKNGLGNISQLSMYCCFYLIGIFYTQHTKWIIGLSTIATGLLATILHSKLILLVLILLLVAKLLSKYNYKTHILCASIILASAFIYLWLSPPSSLNGRLALFKISWSNLDHHHFFGLGLGKYNSFINSVFETEKAANTIGHVEHLAFNDFTQTIVELGLVGIIGLLVIFIGLANKQNLFYLMAIGMILAFMYPLQYIESAVLFSLTICLLRSNPALSTVNWTIPFQKLKPILLVLFTLLLSYSSYELMILKKWASLDIQLKKSSNKNILQEYQQLGSALTNNHEYYLRFGIHLLKSKKYNEALKAFLKAKAINPSYQSHIHLGDCYFEMEHFKEGLNYYEKALVLRPKYLYPVYKSIYSFISLNDSKKALKYWSSHKENYPILKGPEMMVMMQEIKELINDIDSGKSS